MTMGMSADEQEAFEAGLRHDHKIRVLVNILDLNHRVKASATGVVLSGSVDIDLTQEVSRSCSLEIRDPDNELGLDVPGPAAAAQFADRMVQVHYGVWSSDLPRWVNTPIFTGPITSLKRNGQTVSLQAHGKEVWLTKPQSRNWRLPRGYRKTDVIKRVLMESGEDFSEITRWSDKLTEDWQCLSSEAPWAKLQMLAASLASHDRGTDPLLFYNGTGYAKLKSFNRNPVWTFTRGVDVLSEPDISSDVSSIKNLVVVYGGTPKGAKKPVTAQVQLPSSHPFSPSSLARNGVPQYLREEVENDQIVSSSAARQIAQKRLDDVSWAFVDIEFDAMVIPHLEPRDVVTVDNGDWQWSMQLMKYSIPLSADGQMSIGRHTHTRRVTRRVGAVRRGPR